MTTTTRKTWRRFGMVSAMTLMLGLGATATGADAFEKLDRLGDTGSRAGRSGGQLKARNLANIINPARVFTAPSAFSAPTLETTAYLRSADLSSDQLTVDFSGDGLIRFTVDAALVQHALGSDGQPLGSLLSADGVEVKLTAKAVGDVLTRVVNNNGIVVARSLVTYGGVARLIGGDEKPDAATAAGAVQPTRETQESVVAVER